MNCRFCELENVRFIRSIRSPFLDLDFSLYYCPNCKSQFFDPKEHSIDLDKFYENYSLEIQSEFPLEFRRNENWEFQKNKILQLTNKKINNILDLGCRTGDFLMHFDDNIKREGVELSKRQADVGIKRGLKIHSIPVEEFTFDQKYDVITAYAIIEHLTEPLPFISKICDMVNDNGLLAMCVPAYQCLKQTINSKFGIRWYQYSPPQHWNFFSKRYLNDFIKKKGLKCVSYSYTTGGMFQPFKNIKYLEGLSHIMIHKIYDRSFLTRIPLFDHLYLYYKKT